MKVVDYVAGYTIATDDDLVVIDNCMYFSTLEQLENHLKLCLIAVQNYKENTVD